MVSVAAADEFKSKNKPGISAAAAEPGQVNTATVNPTALTVHVKDLEYFPLPVSLALTRDNKEVINVQTDGGGGHQEAADLRDRRQLLLRRPENEPRTPISFSVRRGAIRYGPADNTAQEGPRLLIHLVRPRRRHLEMPRHVVPVKLRNRRD